MKRNGKMLALLLLLLINFPAVAQLNINDFYQTGAVWQEAHHNVIGHGQEITGYELSLTGDTLIGGSVYKKLNVARTYVKTVAPGGQSVSNFTRTDYGTIGGVRVQQRIVYFIRTKSLPPADPQAPTINQLPTYPEALLYDFTLVLGTQLPWKAGEKTVNFLNSVAASSNQRLKAYIFWPTAPYTDYWLEGIGSGMGFFGSYRNRDATSYFSHNAYQSPFLIYPALQVAEEAQNAPAAVKLFPNPLTGNTLHFTFSDQVNIRSLSLSDALGRETYREEFADNPLNISLDLKPGLYTARLVCADGKVRTQRILKAE